MGVRGRRGAERDPGLFRFAEVPDVVEDGAGFDPSEKLTVSPERLVPPPRLTSGAPNSRQAAWVAATSSSVFGTTTPMGGWR
jgi:hypothetical protein